jgi:hypothetical protein
MKASNNGLKFDLFVRHPIHEAGNLYVEARTFLSRSLKLEGVYCCLPVRTVGPRLTANVFSALLKQLEFGEAVIS